MKWGNGNASESFFLQILFSKLMTKFVNKSSRVVLEMRMFCVVVCVMHFEIAMEINLLGQYLYNALLTETTRMLQFD